MKIYLLRTQARLLYRNRFFSSLKENYEFIQAEVRGKSGLITLSRPKALNALCDGLIADIVHAARVFDVNDSVGAIVITGSEKAFAAGADIKEMSNNTFVDSYLKNKFVSWTEITKISKPVGY